MRRVLETPQIPQSALPEARSLLQSTAVMLVVTALLIVGVIMPAETGRDPTGLGRVLGLTEMGRIKVALAKEAAADSTGVGSDSTSKTVRVIDLRRAGILPPGGWRDSAIVTLQPSQGVEVKLAMPRGTLATYAWSTSGADVYFDMHGEPPNASKTDAPHRYKRGSAAADSGTIAAAFDGVHGWFWRNRSDAPMTITLRTRGDYQALKEIK